MPCTPKPLRKHRNFEQKDARWSKVHWQRQISRRKVCPRCERFYRDPARTVVIYCVCGERGIE